MPDRVPPTGSVLSSLLAVTVGLTACGDDGGNPVDPPDGAVDFQTSFEQGLGEFQADTADTGDPQVEWSVEQSGESADDGASSVRVEIANLNDQSKVWIERSFDQLQPNTTYDVQVSFDFASADWGSVNLWTLFVDADADSPETWADFEEDAVTTSTGNGASEDVGYLWSPQSADFTVTTDAEGTLHVAIGVWGTYEVTRAYFIDDVQVSATEA